MDDLRLRHLPITTPPPSIGKSTVPGKSSSNEPSVSFQDVLQSLQTKELTFSKHATQRVMQRGIELSESNLARLNEGVRLAEEKGLGDTLILVDNTAFLVNVPGNKVITTVNNEDLRGNVFTNIDGTVII